MNTIVPIKVLGIRTDILRGTVIKGETAGIQKNYPGKRRNRRTIAHPGGGSGIREE